MTDPAVAAHVNLLRATEAWAAACNSGACWQRDGLAVAAAGTRIRSFNNLFVRGPVEQPEALTEVCDYFRERNLPFRLRILEQTAAPSDDELAAHGFERRGRVATLDEYRRRGHGEAMTHHALNEGAGAGCTMASLQASPLGLPIYRRMGFREVAYYRTYVPREEG